MINTLRLWNNRRSKSDTRSSQSDERRCENDIRPRALRRHHIFNLQPRELWALLVNFVLKQQFHQKNTVIIASADMCHSELPAADGLRCEYLTRCEIWHMPHLILVCPCGIGVTVISSYDDSVRLYKQKKDVCKLIIGSIKAFALLTENLLVT